MYVQVKKTIKNRNISVTNSDIRKKNDRKQEAGIIDNRPEPIVQKKLQRLTNPKKKTGYSMQLPLQYTKNKQTNIVQVVQRLKGTKGTAQEGKSVPFTLNPEFITKHVANDSGEAVSVTEDRIATGGPPGIVAGTAPNNLAKEADWESAIEGSEAIVPPEDDWSVEYGGGNDSGWADKLAWVEVAGWEAQGTAGNVSAKVTTNKKYVGGTWTVSDCDVDEEENYISGSGNVKMDISHLTS